MALDKEEFLKLAKRLPYHDDDYHTPNPIRSEEYVSGEDVNYYGIARAYHGERKGKLVCQFVRRKSD